MEIEILGLLSVRKYLCFYTYQNSPSFTISIPSCLLTSCDMFRIWGELVKDEHKSNYTNKQHNKRIVDYSILINKLKFYRRNFSRKNANVNKQTNRAASRYHYALVYIKHKHTDSIFESRSKTQCKHLRILTSCDTSTKWGPVLRRGKNHC